MTTALLEKAKLKARPNELVSSFIKKTYDMLDDQKFPDIVDWSEEGNALIIKKPTEFGQKVLPTYFKHSNLTSFVRQLNMYDFHKRRTQKYDHVYYHDLFQRGKKHLLKEIKRKNQDNTLATIQKAIETLESAQNNGENQESITNVTNVYENQLLKKLNKDALSRISSLEGKIKDLTIQNQALWNQINHQNQREDILMSFLVDFMKKKGISVDQLPQDLNNQFNLPPLKLATEQNSLADDLENFQSDFIEKPPTKDMNIADFFNFGGDEDLSNSTEVSPSSPPGGPETKIPLENPEDIKQSLEKIISSNHISAHGEDNSKDWNLESRYMKSFVNAGDKISSGGGFETLGKRGAEKENSKTEPMHKLFKKDPVKTPQDFNPYMFCSNGVNKNETLGIKRFDSFGEMFSNVDTLPNSLYDLMDFS